MSWQADFQIIITTVLQGQLSKAEEKVAALKPKTRVERRMKGHAEGMILFYQDRFQEAKTKFEETLAAFGENVSLWRDLVACYYHTGEMMAFRNGLDKLERLLIEFEAELSYRTIYECELQIGKYLEEEARLAPAILFYERALKRAEKSEHRLYSLMQKARWHAQYQLHPELSTFYRELISVPKESCTQDLNIELEHTLMLVELRLVGSDHAWQRIDALPANVPEIDLRLMIFDFLEGSLSLDLEIPQAVLKRIKEFTTVDPYENFLKRFVQGSLEPTTLIQELTSLASRLPWASYLRLLCITANSENHRLIRQELQRKIQLIIRAVDEKSQALWAARLKQSLQAPEIRIEFSSKQRSLAVHGKVVDLSKKKFGLTLLEGLSGKTSLTVDEAIQLLWQSSFSPEYYHRLRMGVHRLNTLIHEVTGLGKTIEVDSQNVRLRPEVQLRAIEDAFDLGMSEMGF